MSGRLHRMMLQRRKPVTGNEETLRDLTTANGLVRRGRRVEGEQKFRAILSSLKNSRTPEDTQAKIEALTGLCEASIFAARSQRDSISRFWLLVRGLCFLRRAKAFVSGPEAASMRSPHDGLDAKAKVAHGEAFQLLRQVLLEQPKDEDDDSSLEEEGRRFLDDFFQFCADAKRRNALLKPPSRRQRRLEAQEAMKAAIFGAAPPPPREGLHWVVAASPLTVSCLDLTTPLGPPPKDCLEDTLPAPKAKLSSSNVQAEVAGTIGRLKRRVAASVSSLDRLKPKKKEGKEKKTAKTTDRLELQRQQWHFLETQEGQNLIDREADHIVAKLENRRSMSLEQLNVKAMADASEAMWQSTAHLRRAPSLLDTSLASMHRRGFTASDSCLLGISVGRSRRQVTRQVRRQSAQSAILERRAVRRSMRGSRSEALDKVGRVVDVTPSASGSGYESSASRYRQVRLMRQLFGLEDGEVMKEEQMDAEGNVLENPVEEEEEEGEAEVEGKEVEIEEEPKVPQVHAEWIHTLVRFGNRLHDDGNTEHAALMLNHALFLYEMLEKGVVEPEVIAGAMRRLGRIRCEQGNAAAGITMLERALGFYAELPNEDSTRMAQAEVLMEVGTAHMHGIRGLDLARMRLSGSAREQEEEKTDGPDAMTAYGCYKRSGAMLEFVPNNKQPQGFRVRLFMRMADCFIVLGNTNAASEYYERALDSLTDAEAAGLMEANAHILYMLALERILVGNPAKAMAVLETAYIILYHQSMDAITGRAAAVLSGRKIKTWKDARYFVAALLGLCYARTEQLQKTLSWCSRSLGFFETQFNVNFKKLEHEEDAWLLVQLLLAFGNAKIASEAFEEAVTAFTRALAVLETKLPKEEYLLCCVLKTLADLRGHEDHHNEALELYQRATTLINNLTEPKRFTASFHRSILFQGPQTFLVNPKSEEDAADVIRAALQDELVTSMVALKFRTAIEALNRREHSQAVELLQHGVDFYREAHGELRPEMVPVLGQLALSLHASLSPKPEASSVDKVDKAFRESLALEFYPSLALKYTVFLSEQEKLREAMNLGESVLFSHLTSHVVVYEGHEEVTLPQLLIRELTENNEDSVEFPALGFALFQLFCAYKKAKLGAAMDDVTAWLWSMASRSEDPMLSSLCGYILMEYQLYTSAAEAFAKAARLQARRVTLENLSICLLCQYGLLLRLQAFAANFCKYAPTANPH